MSTPFTRAARKKLMQFTEWLEKRMHSHPDYDRHDPEWIAMQNEATAIKRSLRAQINEDKA